MIRAITDTGNVTHAAEHLGVTQSALTHRLREAERRLEAALFHRTGHRMHPTPAGERLYSTAAAVIEDIERAESDVRVLAEQRRTVVRFGQGTYSRFHWYPDFVQRGRELGKRVDDEIVGWIGGRIGRSGQDKAQTRSALP